MIPLFRVAMSSDVDRVVGDVLHSGYIGQGPRVEEFEARLRDLVEAPITPLSLASCTAALDLALHLCNVRAGAEVITTPMTCIATNAHIVHRGAEIVWADVDPLTGLISPDDVAVKVTPRTRAIVAVDWAGIPSDYDRLRSFGVPIIQDAAHSMLARYKGQSIAQSGGDYVCWSFQAIKHLTTGDGGALLCPAEQWERARLLRWYGLDRTKSDAYRCNQDIQEIGFKYHMNDIAAAIGLANMKRVGQVVAAHRENACFYSEAFRVASNVRAPDYTPDASWWLYTVHTEARDHFIEYLAKRGIAASPVHARNDAHTALKRYSSDPLPGVTEFSRTEVAIPVGWWVTPADRARIVEAVLGWR